MAKKIEIQGINDFIKDWQKATIEINKNKKSLEGLLLTIIEINKESQKNTGLKQFIKLQEKTQATQEKLKSQIERYVVALKEQQATEKRLIAQIEKKKIAGESANKQLIKERLETQRLNKSLREESILKSKTSSLIQKVTILRLRESRIIQDLNLKKELGNKLSRTEALQLQRSSRQFEKYNKAIKVAKESTGQFQENVGNYPKLFGTATSAIGKLLPLLGASLTFGAAFSFAREARQIALEAKGVEFAFNRIGKTATDAFDRVKKSTRGLLSDLDIKKSLVEFDNFKISLKDTDTLFEFLSVRAAQTGKSVDKLRDSLVEGLSKESKLRIDNLGISTAELNAELERTPDFVQAVANIAKREVAAAGNILDDAANSQEKWNAELENFKLAVGNGLVSKVSNFFFDLGSNILRALTPTKDLTQQFFEQRNAVNNLEQNINPLLIKYDNLAYKSELTTKEQKELDEIILQVAKDIPSAITQFDEYGKALGINTTAARKFVNQQKQILLIQNAEAINEQVKSLKEVNKEISLITNTLNGTAGGYRSIKKENGELFNIVIEGGKVIRVELEKIEGGVERFQTRLQELQNERIGREGIIADLKGEKTQEQIDAELALEKDKEDELTEAELQAIRDRAKRAKQERDRIAKQEKNDLLALKLFRLEQEKNAQEKIFEDEEENFAKRIQSAINLERINKEILELSTQDQLENAQGREDKLTLIKEKADANRIAIEKATQEKIRSIKIESSEIGDIGENPVNEFLEEQFEEELQLFLDKELAKIEQAEKTKEVLLENFTEIGNLLGISSQSVQSVFDLLDGSLETSEDKLKAFGSVVGGVFEGITSASNRNLEARIADIETERDAALNNASLTEAQRSFLEEKFDQKKKRLQKKQAENEKKLALVQTGISIASAIVKALPNIPLSIAVGALGAIQLGVIASTKIPEFAKGTQNAPEGIARVGEQGAEIITDRNNKLKGVADSDTYTYLNKGDKVYTANQTQDILADTFGFDNITQSIALNGLNENRQATTNVVFNGITKNQMAEVLKSSLQKQPKVITNIDRHGIYQKHVKGNATKILRNGL